MVIKQSNLIQTIKYFENFLFLYKIIKWDKFYNHIYKIENNHNTLALNNNNEKGLRILKKISKYSTLRIFDGIKMTELEWPRVLGNSSIIHDINTNGYDASILLNKNNKILNILNDNFYFLDFELMLIF